MRPRIAGAAVIATALVAAGCGADKQSGNGAAAVTAAAPTPTATTTTTGAGAKPNKAEAEAAKPKAETAASKPKAEATPKSETERKAETTAKSKRKSASKATPKRVRSVPIPAARTKVQAPRTWSGTGDKALGTITLKRSAVVRWTIAGGSTFALEDPTGALKISGKGKSGQSFAAAGTYKAVTVGAKGRWTLSVAQLGA